MAEHYIICVLSPVHPKSVEQAFTFHERRRTKSKLTFDGRQTNEAPVKCLLKLAWDEHNPITGIICLESETCKERSMDRPGGGKMSAVEYFRESITSYCAELAQGGENPAANDGFFQSIEYDPASPSENIQALIAAVDKKDALFDIDTTGGPRDAAFLIASVIQFIEAKYRGDARNQGGAHDIGLGTSLYVNLGTREIHSQNDTLELDGLVQGVHAFTEFGRASDLTEFFLGNERTSPEMRNLCEAMAKLADALSLCRTDDVNGKVDEIHTNLASFRTATERKMALYRGLDDIYARADGAGGRETFDSLKTETARLLGCEDEMREAGRGGGNQQSVRSLASLAAAYDGSVRADDGRRLHDLASEEEFRSFLMDKKRMQQVPRGEILFLSLVPSLETGIPQPLRKGGSRKERAAQTVEIIRWCTRRGMLAQALALFKELMPAILEQYGMLDWGGTSSSRDKVTMLINLVVAARPKKGSDPSKKGSDPSLYPVDKDKVDALYGRFVKSFGWQPYERRIAIRQVLCAAVPGLVVQGERFPKARDAERLPAALVSFRILNPIRNEVIHARSEDDGGIPQYVAACRELFENFDDLGYGYDGTPASLARTIDGALRAVSGEIALRLRPEVCKALSSVARDAARQTASKPARAPEQHGLRKACEAVNSRLRAHVGETGMRVVPWRDLFPRAEDEPSVVRDGTVTPRKLVGVLCNTSCYSSGLEVVPTIRIVDETACRTLVKTGERTPVNEAIAYLACEAPRLEGNLILYMRGGGGVADAPCLTKRALGMGTNAGSVFEYLAGKSRGLLALEVPSIFVRKA